MKQILNIRDLQLLATIEFNPEQPTHVTARALGSTASMVSYKIRQFKNIGLIKETALINYAQLGYINVAMYFSLRAGTKQAHQGLLNQLAQHPNVCWLGSLVGQYQYGMALFVRDLSEIPTIFATLGGKFESLLAQKLIAPRISIYRFTRKYLSKKNTKLFETTFNRSGEVFIPDSLDHKILWHIANRPFESLRNLAHEIQTPTSTVERRVNALVKANVISRFVYAISPEAIRRQSFRLLLTTESLSTSVRDKLYNYCAAHPLVTMFVQSLGTWDFELEVETESPAEVMKLSQSLFEVCGKDLGRIEPLLELEDYKFSYYPFNLVRYE